MKKIVIFCGLIVLIILNSCLPPRHIFYKSYNKENQKSIYYKTDFKQINRINESLPFGTIFAKDINSKDEIISKYLILSPRILFTNTVEDYIHPYNVQINIDKIPEIIENLDKIISVYQNEFKRESGINIDYALSRNSPKDTSNIDETWDPEFKIIFKGFSISKQTFIHLGIVRSKKDDLTYSYAIDKDEVIELKNRLKKALEM